MKRPEIDEKAEQEIWAIVLGIPLCFGVFLLIAWGCTQTACFG